ncbi:sensor histidine kinase [Fictibacillus sp. NRS-1165]|uniref:sensor histidine kinase n=1 Tax=Fictibacillus sp. NRS-1165 TaxID=3144463 RepID=UPI003D212A5B
MKLFIREHLLLCFVYLIQLAVIIAIYRLDGHTDWKITLYACLLSSCLLAGYLTYRYFSHRSFYHRLTIPLASLDDLPYNQQDSPLPESLENFQKEMIRHYKKDLYNYKHRLDHHVQFINQWVHQMKTPLSVIHLMVQDRDDEFSQSIEDELDRLKKGLEMVLYTSRLDTFDRDFYAERLDLSLLVKKAASSQKRLFIRNRVYPELMIEQGLTVTTDDKWFSFVLNQLVTNAVRYTQTPGEKVTFRSFRQDGRTGIEVIDRGVGIPKSDLPRVFDPYFTGENGRSFQESTGMGLYLARQICEKLGHRIEIDSSPGSGTTVRILF